MTKPFDRNLYDSDDDAKHQVVDWFIGRGYDSWVNPDEFGIDVLAEGKGRKLAIEVEVKHNWKGKTFQYSTLHYSSRKLKFLNSFYEVFFMTLNHERTYALIVPEEELKNGKIVTKDTIYTRKESFIEIPIDKCFLVQLIA
jgi:hypothetical protein